jgi:hypothetical protein
MSDKGHRQANDTLQSAYYRQACNFDPVLGRICLGLSDFYGSTIP